MPSFIDRRGWGENPALRCRAVQQCRNLHAYTVSLNLRLLFPNLSCSSPCQESQKNSLCVQQHRYVRGYINLSLLTLLGWQQWRTETKPLHNQRPQEFVGKMCETPSVVRIVCFTANLAFSKILVREEKRLHPQTKGESFCFSSSSALPAPCLTAPH